MTDLAIIVPSRGRPQQFTELVDAVCKTAGGTVQIWAGLDDDDPAEYFNATHSEPHILATRGPRKTLSAWTNHLAVQALQAPDPPRYLASLGDDHRPRTPSWDRKLIEAIEAIGGSGFAYGNDLLQGQNMPTAWVVSADIVRTLGWMMLPTCQHLYVDSAILELGRALDRIVYRPDVVIEHLHPLAGKAQWDQSYRDSNSEQRYAEDETAYAVWKANGLQVDIDRIRAAVAA